MNALPYLLFLIPIVVEVMSDYNRIVKKHKVDNHAPDLLVRAILIVAMSIIFMLIEFLVLGRPFTLLKLFQLCCLGVGCFGFLFDYLIALAIGEHITFIGSTSWLDRRINWLPWFAVLFMRVWVMLMAIAIYYYWEVIIHGYTFTTRYFYE